MGGRPNFYCLIFTVCHSVGKATGIVTTTRLVHATPAASYANSASRYWYDDTDLSLEAKANHCKDIAYQLYENLPNIEVR